VNSEIAIIYRTVRQITSALGLTVRVRLWSDSQHNLPHEMKNYNKSASKRHIRHTVGAVKAVLVLKIAEGYRRLRLGLGNFQNRVRVYD